MTRKDYVLIANALRDSHAPIGVIESVADGLAGENPRFDRERFIKAATHE